MVSLVATGLSAGALGVDLSHENGVTYSPFRSVVEIENYLLTVQNDKITVLNIDGGIKAVRVQNGQTKTVEIICGLIANDFIGVNRCLSLIPKAGCATFWPRSSGLF